MQKNGNGAREKSLCAVFFVQPPLRALGGPSVGAWRAPWENGGFLIFILRQRCWIGDRTASLPFFISRQGRRQTGIGGVKSMANVTEIFGSMVFDESAMKARLPKETFRQLQEAGVPVEYR